jgi:hypothetical protein
MKIAYKLLLMTCITFSLAYSAPASDANGKWKAEFETQVGLQKYTFELKVEGEKLTGKAYFERMNQKGEAELLEGKVKGDEVFFVEKISVQGNELRIEYKGKVSGDEISFTRKTGDIATVQFVAKRVKS